MNVQWVNQQIKERLQKVDEIFERLETGTVTMGELAGCFVGGRKLVGIEVGDEVLFAVEDDIIEGTVLAVGDGWYKVTESSPAKLYKVEESEISLK